MWKRALVMMGLMFMITDLSAQPSPCGNVENPEPGVVYVGQDCANGEWYVQTDYGYASGIIVASQPMEVTEKFAADGMWYGELISMNGGKVIRYFFDNYEVMRNGFTFKAPVGTNVALIPDYGYGYFSIGGNPPDSYELVNLTDPEIPHLFVITPRETQYLNKREQKTIRWVTSPHFDKVSLAISRAPYQTTWIRSPEGQYAFNIDNTGSFLWDVLKINTVCHDFYLKISGYANDGSGYYQSTSEIFNVLHPYDYGIQCPAIQK